MAPDETTSRCPALRSRADGLRRSFKVGGLKAGRAPQNCKLPVGGQPVYCAKSRNHELRDASLRRQGGIAQSTQGLKKPEVQASGIAGVEELQSFRGCSASAVVPANVLRAGGQRMGCCNYRTAGVLSCAIAHCATGAKMSSGQEPGNSLSTEENIDGLASAFSTNKVSIMRRRFTLVLTDQAFTEPRKLNMPTTTQLTSSAKKRLTLTGSSMDTTCRTKPSAYWGGVSYARCLLPITAIESRCVTSRNTCTSRPSTFRKSCKSFSARSCTDGKHALH